MEREPARRPDYAPYQPLRAIKAMIGLARNTTRTDHVFEIISALSGDGFEHVYRGFLTSPTASELLRDKPSLMAALSDREKLRSMPEGSLGRAYLKFMEDGGLTAEGLVTAQRDAVDPTADVHMDDDRRYVADRLRDMHDLWHVLTDYGMDDTGEIANLWFSYGQFGNHGMGFIALLGTLDGIGAGGVGWLDYCRRAYDRGRTAKKLVSVDFVPLLPLPLPEVRARLGIEESSVVHPEGIRVGDRRQGKLGALEVCMP